MWGVHGERLPQDRALAKAGSGTHHAPVQSPLPRFSTRGVTKSTVVSQHATGDFVDAYYERIETLGKGTFGLVELVRERKTGNRRVCKEVITRGKTPSVRDLTRQEIEVLADLDHPNIVKLYEFSEDLKREQFILILEYMNGGDCHKLLANSGGGLPEASVGRLIYQILVALAYCHSYGVIHRDIKPENMMLAKSGFWGDQVCKLVDFGLAAKQNLTNEFFGTPSYTAPEVIASKHYSAKCDVWGLGISAIELVTDYLPFGKLQDDYNGKVRDLFQKIRQFKELKDLDKQLKFSPAWRNRSNACSDFLTNVLAVDLDKRLHAHEAMVLSWPQMHKAAYAGLTNQMLKSLASYNSAPPLIRCCLLAIAVRENVPEQDRIGSAFLAADVDGDSRLSQKDLEIAVECARSWWNPDMDVSGLAQNANLDHVGGLSYTEFVAACLYSEYRSLDELIDQAFTALDADRDEKVQVQDIRELFRERDAALLQKLPQDRPFTREEWCAHIGSSCEASGEIVQRDSSGLFGVASVMSCAQAPRTASLEGGEYLVEQRPLGTYQPVSERSEDGICPGLTRDASESSRNSSRSSMPDGPALNWLSVLTARLWPASR